MTVSVQTPIVEYAPNGVTTVFAYPFAVLSEDDLAVAMDGAPVTSGFTVSGIGDEGGGSITFSTAPVGTSLIIYRSVILEREVDYQENGDLLAEVLDQDFDRIWMALQDQLLVASRTVRAPLGEVVDELPAASSRALRVLGFDADGQPIMLTRTDDGGSALALDLLDTTDPTKNAGMVGFEPTLEYDDDTTGHALQARGLSIMDFGALVDGVTLDTAAAVDALAESPGGVFMPPGDAVLGVGIDSRLLYGPGHAKPFPTATRTTPPDLRKSDTAGWRTRQPFEDEHGAHSTIDGTDMYYTAFGGACMLNGKEVYVARVAYEHSSNNSYKAAINLYVYDKTANPLWTKTTIYTCGLGEDIRDVNITPHPYRAGYALISFSEKKTDDNYRVRLITYKGGIESVAGSIESSRIILGMSDSDFKWGNALVTPAGYLLFASYAAFTGVEIKIWRSTIPLATSGDVTMTSVHTFTDTFASEPTLGYWRDKLTIFYRRTGAVSRVSHSFNKEGAGPWAATVFPYGASAHSPCVIPYNNASVWTAFFALGTDRSYLGSASSQNMRTFKSTVAVRVTGGAIGGYPTIIDCGGYYATSSYADHYDEVGQVARTRFDRIEIDKGRVDIGPSDTEYINIINLPPSPVPSQAGLWAGTPFGADSKTATDGRDYQVEFSVSRALTINGLSIQTSGAANGYVELYEDGVLVATSSTLAIASTPATPVVFAFSPDVSLATLKTYKAKLKGDAALAVYDLRHATRSTILRSGVVDVTSLYTETGASIASSSLCPIALRIA